MNNKYIIKFEHPLIRPGITITTEASERYVVAVIQKGLDIIRELNAPKDEPKAGETMNETTHNCKAFKELREDGWRIRRALPTDRLGGFFAIRDDSSGTRAYGIRMRYCFWCGKKLAGTPKYRELSV